MGRLDVNDPVRDEDMPLHSESDEVQASLQSSSIRESLVGTDNETLLDIAEAAHVVANALEASLARHRLPRRESLQTFIDVLRNGRLTPR